MDEQYYVLEQISQTKRTIIQVCSELQQVRDKIEKQLKSDRKNAKDWYGYLLALVNKLIHSLKSCRLSLLELDEIKLASITFKLQKSVEKFNVMTPNYTKLIQVLQDYSSRLPDEQDTKTNASIIGRLMNNVRMGYYPTDLEHIKIIASGIEFPEETMVNLLDPCCGCGLALQQLGFGENCTTFGAEIDESRAEEAQNRLNRVGFGSFFHSRVSTNSFHAMLLNPPYLSVKNQSGNNARHEKRFLVESFEKLMQDGLLIYIIPYYRLTEDIARILCDNFSELSIYKFIEKEFDKFKQIVIFGKRQKRIDGSGLVENLLEKVLITDNIPSLYELRAKQFSLPKKEQEVQIFKGAAFNVRELAVQLEKSDTFTNLLKNNMLDSKEKRPLLPLKTGQIGLIGGSGLINGLVDCSNPHIIKGRVIKELVVTEVDMQQDEGGRVTHTQRSETLTNRLVFNILTKDGFKSLTQ